MEEGTKTEEIGFEKINEIDTKEVTTQTENIETNEKEINSEKTNKNVIHLVKENIDNIDKSLDDTNKSLTFKERSKGKLNEKLQNLIKSTKALKQNEIENENGEKFYEVNEEEFRKFNKNVNETIEEINNQQDKQLAQKFSKFMEAGSDLFGEFLSSKTELGEVLSAKEFFNMLKEFSKLAKVSVVALNKGIEKGISDYNNNTEIKNISEAREMLNQTEQNDISNKEKESSKVEVNTQTTNKEAEHKINANLGEKVEIKIGEVKVKIGIDYIPIKERNQNNAHNKDTKIKDNDIQR